MKYVRSESGLVHLVVGRTTKEYYCACHWFIAKERLVVDNPITCFSCALAYVKGVNDHLVELEELL